MFQLTPPPAVQNLSTFTDAELQYLLASMTTFASNHALVQARIAELENDGAATGVGFLPPAAVASAQGYPMSPASSSASSATSTKLELALLKLVDGLTQVKHQCLRRLGLTSV